MNTLDRFRSEVTPLTPEAYMALHPKSWVQYYDDTQEGDKKKARSYDSFSSETLRERQQQLCGAFASLHSFAGARRKENVKTLLAFGLDVDLMSAEEKMNEKAGRLIPADEMDKRKNKYLEEILLYFPFKPHLAAETQHGFHGEFWIVSREATEEQIFIWQRLQHALQQLLHGDDKATLLTQVLRIHGTRQYKTPQAPFEVRTIINYSHSPRDSFDNVQTIFDALDVFSEKKYLNQTSFQSGVEAKKQGRIDVIQQGGRNSTLTSIAGSLRHRGLSEAVISDALSVVNARQCEPPLPDQDISTIAKSVGRYSPGVASNQVAEPVLICLADVKSEKVEWLWEERIPMKKMTMIDGDPGGGKSTLSCAVATAVTLGNPLPGDEFAESRKPLRVLILSAEDGLGDTIRPRLEGMGADLRRITVLTAVKDQKEERHLSLENDLPAIRKALSEGGYGLMIIDPLNAYLGAKLDTNRDSSVRSVLAPVIRLAEESNVALICIRHLTKSSRNQAMYRGQGSIAFTAASRVNHIIVPNRAVKDERVMVCVKNNLSVFPRPIAFEIQKGQFLWKGEVDVNIETLLQPMEAEKNSPAFQEAQDFLQDFLESGPRPVVDILAAGKQVGISDRTLKRAKLKLKVKANKHNFGKSQGGAPHWTWELPKSPHDLVKKSWSSSEKGQQQAIPLKDATDSDWHSSDQDLAQAIPMKEANTPTGLDSDASNPSSPVDHIEKI